MSKEHVELVALAVVVVVVIGAVVLIALSILANVDEPSEQTYDVEVVAGTALPSHIHTGRADGSDWSSAYARAQEDFNWPYRSGWTATEVRGPEPIRENFRKMLEGGPDYHG